MQPAGGPGLHNAGRSPAQTHFVPTIAASGLGTRDALPASQKGLAMSDAIFILTTLAFFALAVAYTRACQWL
jgi:hypothetical protein